MVLNLLCIEGPQAALKSFMRDNQSNDTMLDFGKTVPLDGDNPWRKWGCGSNAENVKVEYGVECLRYHFETDTHFPFTWMTSLSDHYSHLSISFHGIDLEVYTSTSYTHSILKNGHDGTSWYDIMTVFRLMSRNERLSIRDACELEEFEWLGCMVKEYEFVFSLIVEAYDTFLAMDTKKVVEDDLPKLDLGSYE